jgi:hypothetical protein
MKMDIHKVGKLLKTGLCYGVTLALISCGTDQTTGVQETEVTDEEASLRTEETGTFGGDASTGIDNALYSDFASNNYFEELDKNNDNLLDKNEYSASFFDTWDNNNDGILTSNEWDTAISDFGFREDSNWQMTAWDSNKDNRISKNEFNSKFGNTDMFATWDKNNDSMLDEKEYSEGIVGLWNNADDDGVLDENEYKDKSNRYFKKSDKRYMPERG